MSRGFLLNLTAQASESSLLVADMAAMDPLVTVTQPLAVAARKHAEAHGGERGEP